VDRISIGVIGTGVIGRLHAQNLASRVSAARLAAICDIDPPAVAKCLATSAVGALPVFRDYQKMLSDPGIDAVAVCTPGDTHGEIIGAAASAGKHVFCEKPIDCDLAKADRALAAVKRAGIKLQIGFNRRFDRNFRRVKEAISGGEIGHPHTLHIVSRDPLRHEDEPLADLFLDTTIHDLDMTCFLIGSEVTSLYVMGGRMSESKSGDDPDTAVTMLRFANGVIATIDNSRRSVYGYDQRLEVFGSEGAIAVGNERLHRVKVSNQDGVLSSPPFAFFMDRYEDSYIAEMSAFARCVMEDREPLVTGTDGRVALVLALAARRAYAEARPVAL
jgi:myo-inositol 2-dehydrogenase/D-chiro-inositol 1-dehydrogenase